MVLGATARHSGQQAAHGWERPPPSLSSAPARNNSLRQKRNTSNQPAKPMRANNTSLKGHQTLEYHDEA
eukprot:2684509-Amphidinium_carterae.1